MFLYAGIDFKQREINCAVQNEIYLYTGTSNGVYKANLNEIEKSILFDAKFTNVLKNFEIRSLLAVNNLIIAGTADHGIYYSNDNGKNWQSGGLEFNTISSLGYNDKYIYAGTLESGVLRINKNQFLISYNHVDENAQSIQIEIFPNPSSDNLNIKLNYEPLENEEVSIIDMLGQNILTQNIKSIETNIKLSNLQSGIYYAKFKNRREVIKFEVVK
ncbi:MAG: T9SS type A sorting domain-containing protein [Candidatus Kapabacteria bacterium]|nr:T9SS type A sorting domain-containing protein [Candidatus Kapabacteria bacterium]